MNSFEDRASLVSIVERVRKLQPASTRLWGRMTPHEMLCHCCDSFRFALGERPVSPAVTFLGRTLVKWVALYTPVPWPKGVPTRPEADQTRDGTRPAEFEQDRAELIRLMQRFVSDRPAERPAHPTFDRLTEFEWMLWGYKHMDHHLRQFGV
jgi:hypothetical protein